MIACSGIKDPKYRILDGMALVWLEASPNGRGSLWLPEGQYVGHTTASNY